MSHRRTSLIWAPILLAAFAGCNKQPAAPAPSNTATKPQPTYYHVDPATSGSIHGIVHYIGLRPVARRINMSEDPACVQAHPGGAFDESLVVGTRGALANAFVYIAEGLEGKTFAVPSTPVTIDQRGCWFRPRVLGIQTNQILQILNSDPVTHNIHPMAAINREWNHSQGPGDPPVDRHFAKAEVMIPVKCNIHSWMHAFIGVVDHPYFAVTKADGSFTLPNLPPGNYRLRVWQEKLGTQDANVTVTSGKTSDLNLTYRPK